MVCLVTRWRFYPNIWVFCFLGFFVFPDSVLNIKSSRPGSLLSMVMLIKMGDDDEREMMCDTVCHSRGVG